MINWFKSLAMSLPDQSSTTKVGWFMTGSHAEFIWDDPRRVAIDASPAKSPRAVGMCPAILDHEARYYQVPCPVDLVIAVGKNASGQPDIVVPRGYRGMLTTDRLRQMAALTPPSQWRHPDRPIVQFKTPYRFVSDDHVYINQLPPFMAYGSQKWPGMMIGGRFPIDIWPRVMMWAFEWYEPDKPVALRRGDPMFYVRFETTDPSKKVKLVEAELTPDLVAQCNGIDNVVNYVDRTFSLFSTARKRRAKTLLVEKKRD